MQTLPPHLLDHCEQAVLAVDGLLAALKDQLRTRLVQDGVVVPALLDREQRAAHALAWFATTGEALRQSARWARNLEKQNRLTYAERLLLAALFGEYLAQLAGGTPMSQTEVARAGDVCLDREEVEEFLTPVVHEMIALGTARETRAAIGGFLSDSADALYFGDPGLDETLELIRGQFFRFAQERVVPRAHSWHLKDELIPLEVIEEMSALGVF